MGWRETFIERFGPGFLCGITFGDWIRLLNENRFAVDPSCFLRAMAVTMHSSQNSPLRFVETLRFRSKWKDVEIKPPLFVLGHWRSGTTHLHNLITIDDRYAFPNTYQALFPQAFLTTEPLNAKIIACFLPKHRPMDNVEWSMKSPQEDEFAICATTLKSSCIGWIFPKRREHYDRYLTLRDVSETEISQWGESLLTFLKKLTWKYDRPLVLKSPPHTCRIKHLLKLFPDAKFVHIHRNPFEVFQSSRKLFKVNFSINGLQRPRLHDLDEWILRQYRAMYDAFFEERHLIPAGHYHEVGFEELERDPIGEVKRMYQALNLPDFSHAEPALKQYVTSIAGYKKNDFQGLPSELRSRIAVEWEPCFQEWNYLESMSE